MEIKRQAFYSLDEFPRLREVATAWDLIHSEFSRLHAPNMDIHRQGKSHEQVHREVLTYLRSGQEYGWLLGWGPKSASKDWMQYGLVADGSAIPWATRTMSKTVALLASIEGIQTAALSRLAPHTLLSTHTHPELARDGLLQMHMTLTQVEHGNYAYFNVAGEFKHYSHRHSFIFDGSNDHFALNASETDRVILYLEFYKAKLMQSATYLSVDKSPARPRAGLYGEA